MGYLIGSFKISRDGNLDGTFDGISLRYNCKWKY